MSKDPFPRDSIKALVEFFDTHDMSDYEDEFEPVAEPESKPTDEVSAELPADDN